MVKFQKGQSGNRRGRPVGTKKQVELRKQLEEFISEQWPRFKEDWEQLTPAERCVIFASLVPTALRRPSSPGEMTIKNASDDTVLKVMKELHNLNNLT